MKGSALSSRCLHFFLFAAACASPLLAQHHDMQGMTMPVSSTATVAVADNPAAQLLTIKLGPLNLPAHTGHMQAAQPRPQFLEIPFDGWIIAYHPRLVDASG